jgi:hypothetical protein
MDLLGYVAATSGSSNVTFVKLHPGSPDIERVATTTRAHRFLCTAHGSIPL